jgi:hypothetical protein
MNVPDKAQLHRLYGKQQKRIAYRKGDFLDYTLMCVLCMLGLYVAYGGSHPITLIGIALSLWMMIVFPKRHGWELSVPLVLRRPQDLVYLLVHKVLNLKWMYFVALAVLLLENYLIYRTPKLPHHTEGMRVLALYLFYIHLAGITLFRTYIFYVHLRKKELVREILMQTAWRRKLEHQPNVTLEIVHAYATGLLAHILLIAPWFLVINYFKFSVLFLPVVGAINIFIQSKYLKVLNTWFYRDHWLSHHSELDFIYLHGTHHDAIPSGLIGVAGNGFLEGITRHGLAAPATFYNPVISTLVNTIEVVGDIDSHQFIPGLYPRANIDEQRTTQHSMHHFGRLEPYSFGINVDQPGVSPEYIKSLKYLPAELKTAIKIDEALDGFVWNNQYHAAYLELVMKYEKTEEPAPACPAEQSVNENRS